MIVVDEDSLVGLFVVSILEGYDELGDVLDLDRDAGSMARVGRELNISVIAA